MIDDAPLPAYLVEVVARERLREDSAETRQWDDLDDTARAGYLETARMILKARGAQTDIRR